jgi:hypothetical protein
MATIARLRCEWQGAGVVGPSISTFYWTGSTGRPADVVTFLSTFVTNIPNDVSIFVPGSGDLINDVTGDLTGSWSAAGSDTVVGTGVGAFTIGVGIRVVWETDGITSNRHVRGSTFLVPLAHGVFGNDGRVVPAFSDAVAANAQTLIDNSLGTMVVWTRPKGALNGKNSQIVSARVPLNPTTLRSRRT